jgi:hypothetical protein
MKYQLVKFEDLYKGMIVYDPDGLRGVVKNFEDIHNVQVKFKGGSGVYCFHEDCDLFNVEPLYSNLRKLKILKINEYTKYTHYQRTIRRFKTISIYDIYF